jgi:hypothetical protein
MKFSRTSGAHFTSPSIVSNSRVGLPPNWFESETGRHTRFYSLTEPRRCPLEEETTNWSRLSKAITVVVAEA